MKRYCILGIAIPARAGTAHRDDQWLMYPIIHYSPDAVRAEIDRLNAETEEAIKQGHTYPFERYEAIEVGPELVGEWDEETDELTRWLKSRTDRQRR